LISKQSAVRFLRKTRLLFSVDFLRFFLLKLNGEKDKKEFLHKNPDVKLPPDYILYESFGRLNYYSYYFDSRDAAKEIIDTIGRHKDITEAKICEWGCGPARLLRHFRDFLGAKAELYGTDYNPKSINWCRNNIPEVNFSLNGLHPPLSYIGSFFDAVYCVSVFTHLSKEVQKEWFDECMRILKPGGLFYFTMHGDSFLNKLLDDEKRVYDTEGFLIRGNVREGKKNFTSFDSPSYIRNVFLKGRTILEHIPGEGNRQDVWIVMKQE
jgi:SAM-dependent methyltransferase